MCENPQDADRYFFYFSFNTPFTSSPNCVLQSLIIYIHLSRAGRASPMATICHQAFSLPGIEYQLPDVHRAGINIYRCSKIRSAFGGRLPRDLASNYSLVTTLTLGK